MCLRVGNRALFDYIPSQPPGRGREIGDRVLVMTTRPLRILLAAFLCALAAPLHAQSYAYILDVPDYNWAYGCFGTACGNLIGFWDRNGLPDLYQGPVAGGVAPLTDSGTIFTMWATKAGAAGRPVDQPGHVDDYYLTYESLSADPYVTEQRAEHAPDCISDFTGVNQNKWTNMNGECDGNIDGFGFVFWELNGIRRSNFTPLDAQGGSVRDIPSGLREYARYKGYGADAFSQLSDFNPNTPSGAGFTFEDMKAEINAGYPVLLFLQDFSSNSRPGLQQTGVNPLIHGMLAYGYREDPGLGIRWVYYRTSWASGANVRSQWDDGVWQAGLPLRGVIGFHPRPKLTSIVRANGRVTLSWEGPSARLYDGLLQTTNQVHRYRVEWSPAPTQAAWTALSAASPARESTFPEPQAATTFYRVALSPL